ncbi:MAG: DUF559 domain-containing protein [Gammaproteobacteria bacterium]|nr:DUF559 domain-containing protein [Gammaproteobacteria bacterium]
MDLDCLKQYAKDLRHHSTDAERLLWQYLRNRQLAGFKFRRQAVIEPYIVDFACFDLRLVIELDGGQHADKQTYDNKRTQSLKQRGYTVLRFWNHEVLAQIQDVLSHIVSVAKQLNNTPSPQPSPGGRGGIQPKD